MNSERPVVGVLGGMGPLATADFYTKLVMLTPATRDREHLHVIIESNPEIPDRTAAVLGEGPDPTPELVATAQRLVQAGAGIIAIPCNSAHIFLEAIRGSISVPVLDMMEEVARAAQELRPVPRTIGLLATTGTLRARLYQAALTNRGIATVEPAGPGQDTVMAVIYAVKAGNLGGPIQAALGAAIADLARQGAEAIVLACTELPLIAPAEAPVPLLDATTILARAVLREAGEFSQTVGRSRNRVLGHFIATRRS
jgi:aspartate racemase